MKIEVNGEERQMEGGVSVEDLVRDLGRDPERPGIAVAVNGDVVRRVEWPERTLAEGDRIEVVGAVQGGSG